MVGEPQAGYLAGLPADQQEGLARVNGPGLAALRKYLASGQAVAFLGAGVSAPLYPLWDSLIRQRDQVMARWTALVREGIDLVGPDSPAGQRLAEQADFLEFVSKELSDVLDRWDQYRAGH